MKTYQLTQHFDLNEFTRSATAIANGIDNTLDLAKADDRKVAENLQYLCQTVLEPLREHFGMPVVVSSGYRCKELNRVVGGVWNSQHLTGEAADIQPLFPAAPVPTTPIPSCSCARQFRWRFIPPPPACPRTSISEYRSCCYTSFLGHVTG